ncbi:MAG: hypothetical protein MJ072_06885, partial [Clostridia bacterium]|nr:hypothetical protein [Clostridia bacterium]
MKVGVSVKVLADSPVEISSEFPEEVEEHIVLNEDSVKYFVFEEGKLTIASVPENNHVIKTTDCENGTFTTSAIYAEKFEGVTVTATPADGYSLCPTML